MQIALLFRSLIPGSIFGDDDPLGQTITVDKEMSFVVTGIFRDIPENSHLKFDILLSWPNLLTHYGADIEYSWGDTGFFTYFILKPSVSPEAFEVKLKSLVERDFGEVLKQYKLTCDLKVQPLTSIHLNSAYMQEMEVNGNSDTVTFLSIVAILYSDNSMGKLYKHYNRQITHKGNRSRIK